MRFRLTCPLITGAKIVATGPGASRNNPIPRPAFLGRHSSIVKPRAAQTPIHLQVRGLAFCRTTSGNRNGIPRTQMLFADRPISDILPTLPGKRQRSTFVFHPGDSHQREGFTVSIQESQRHNPTTVPICPRCLKPMVLKGSHSPTLRKKPIVAKFAAPRPSASSKTARTRDYNRSN